MGMTIYDALVLARVSKGLADRCRVLTLGVPTLNFKDTVYLDEMTRRGEMQATGTAVPAFSNYSDFFKSLGFKQVDALDISDYEGANIVGDLNDPNLIERIGAPYDLVYDSGTIEHIFDIVTALRTVTRLVKAGGAIVHATPANGFLDHGFWQVSPDLFRSFYGSAGFRCLTSALFVFGQRPYSVRAETNLYRDHGRGYIVETLPEAIAVFAAQKEVDVSTVEIELQDYYSAMHGGTQAAMSAAFYIPYGSIRLGKFFRLPFADRWVPIVRAVWTGLRKIMPKKLKERMHAR